jgi:predicted DsbA family dithiol-disulfide isomerase
LFTAYYAEEQDLNDPVVIQTVARGAGFGEEIMLALRDGAYTQRVAESRRAAQDLGVVAVPTWLCGGFGVVGVPALAEIQRLLETGAGAAIASVNSEESAP